VLIVFLFFFLGDDLKLDSLFEDFAGVLCCVWVVDDEVWEVGYADVDAFEELLFLEESGFFEEVFEDQAEVAAEIVWLLGEGVIQEVADELIAFDLVLLTNKQELFFGVLFLLKLLVLIKHVQDFSSDTG